MIEGALGEWDCYIVNYGWLIECKWEVWVKKKLRELLVDLWEKLNW